MSLAAFEKNKPSKPSLNELSAIEMVTAFPEPTFIINSEENFEIVNLPFANLLGYSQNELKGESVLKLFPSWKEKYRSFDNNVHILLAEHSVDGSIPLKLQFKQLGKGELSFMMCFITDLSLMTYERNKQARLAKCIESAGEAMLMTDVDGRIEYVNPSFTRVTGYNKYEVIGKTPKLFKSDRHTKEFYEKMWCTIQSGNVWEGNVSNVKKSGEVYEVRLVVAPVCGDMCDIIGYIAIQSDVTDIHDTKLKLSRTIRQLRKNNEGLEAMNSLIGHELKDHLTAMTGLIEMLKIDILEETKRLDIVERLSNQSRNLLEFLNDLIGFSANNSKVRLKEIDLNDILKQVKYNLSEGIDRTFCRIVSDELPKVKASDGMMISLFQNLISNSLKYQPNDQIPLVEIKVKKMSGSKRIKVIYSDNGIGFDPSEAKDLFKPFKRLGNAYKYPGSGIGLSTCDRIMKRLGGSIKGDGELDKGVTFTLTFPL